MATKQTASFNVTPLLDIINTAGPRGPLWEQLCALIDAPATLRAAPLWLPEVTSQLDATWHDSERVWPLKWLTRKDPHPAASIVRHLQLDDISAAQQAKALTHLAQLDATNMPPITSFEATGERIKRKASLDAGEAEALWAALALGRLRQVTIRNDVVGLYELVRIMADQPALREVEELTLDNLNDAVLQALLASPHRAALKQLTLRSQDEPTAPGLAALRALSEQLEHLNVKSSKRHLQWLNQFYTKFV